MKGNEEGSFITKSILIIVFYEKYMKKNMYEEHLQINRETIDTKQKKNRQKTQTCMLLKAN